MGITTDLAQFTADIRLDRLPPDVVRRARFLVLDLVGNIVRARHDAESTPSFLAAARAMGMAAGNSGVFADAARYTRPAPPSSTVRWPIRWTSMTRTPPARCIPARP